MLKNKTIAFLGAGSMAEAMISGIVHAGKIPCDQIMVTNRNNKERLIELRKKYGVTVAARDALQLDEIDILVLAMKPKDAEQALSSIKHKLTPRQLVLSVLAGITTSFMEEHLHENQPVIRVMPNTSSMMRESATAISPGRHASNEHISIAKQLLASIGEVYMISEDKMDIFTGIAGSGPAYFYYLMEHIEKAGKAEGLDPELARQIGAQTILGAAKMIMGQEETPAELRENVTSPNGTTAAGLAALEKHGGGEAMIQAIKGASKRSKELSKQFRQKPLTV
ncbi:pyrroline-5-carboxylate reductase [Priestia abyssalis]|uniref:pyrroline-5-carboxylate reductase n=1 Tax=Priestia abyssalis TaxID=1221450 RepID=UPI000995C926|nr:pyrroline-5-carboxylate reductase [Priestia abyssalis]